MLVNLACDSIIGARFIEIVVEFFLINARTELRQAPVRVLVLCRIIYWARDGKDRSQR